MPDVVICPICKCSIADDLIECHVNSYHGVIEPLKSDLATARAEAIRWKTAYNMYVKDIEEREA